MSAIDLCGGDRLALFDFDCTLVDFDTVNPFIRFVLRHHPELDVPPDMALPHKQYRLLLLKGLGRDEIEKLARRYYKKEIRPNLIAETLERLLRLKSEGYFISLVSGSYDLYLKYFVAEFGIDYLVCTKVSFTHDVCDGVFSGIDCLGENKLRLLHDIFGKADFTDMDSVAFSDAESDLPLLRSCRRAAVVLPSRKAPEPWMADDAFELIRYNLPLSKMLKRKAQRRIRRIMRVSN